MHDAPWHSPSGREARNEQRKLRAAIANALAVTLFAAALVGDFVNPQVAALLTAPVRFGAGVGAVALHLFACLLVRDIEDR